MNGVDQIPQKPVKPQKIQKSVRSLGGLAFRTQSLAFYVLVGVVLTESGKAVRRGINGLFDSLGVHDARYGGTGWHHELIQNVQTSLGQSPTLATEFLPPIGFATGRTDECDEHLDGGVEIAGIPKVFQTSPRLERDKFGRRKFGDGGIVVFQTKRTGTLHGSVS